MKVVKAQRCSAKDIQLMWPTEADSCKGRNLVLPRRAKTKRVCVKTGRSCDAEPVVVIREAEHAEVQAALAGAESFIKALRGIAITHGQENEATEVLARLRAVKDKG